MPKTLNKASGKLRIIGGAWRRHQLPVASVPDLRPTPDRVRETLFNWLGQDCTGFEVLDLFSGTGSLGLEAASRGASYVQFIESNSTVVRQLNANVNYLAGKWPVQAGAPPDISVIQANVLDHLKVLSKRYDLIFLDPPFAGDQLDKVLPFLSQLLKPAGLIYIEWGQPLFDDLPGLAYKLRVPEIDALRYIRAGQVHAHLVGLPTV